MEGVVGDERERKGILSPLLPPNKREEKESFKKRLKVDDLPSSTERDDEE